MAGEFEVSWARRCRRLFSGSAPLVALLERRARRCPPGAHTGAVGAARRLRCSARSSVALQHSLRSLRSLRSDNCNESDNEARCARRLKTCAPRRPTSRPRRAAPGALLRRCLLPHMPPAVQQRRVRAGWGAPGRRRAAQGSWPRAQRASLTDSAQLFERSERSERSEFRAGPRTREAQGSRRAAPAASVKRPGLPGPTFAEPALARAANGTAAASRQALPAGGDLWGGEERRSGVGARSALRDLTRRSCLSAVSAANAASSATRPRAEYRSEVGAQRRPPQHEPPAGSAWRDARSSPTKAHPQWHPSG